MAKFNLDDYETVADALIRLHTAYPDARVIADDITPEGVTDRFKVKAYIYKDGVDARPLATGLAEELIGSTNVNKFSALENCETSAIGRAISNSVLCLTKPNKNRPSREEMEKVVRAEQSKVVPTQDQIDLVISALEQVEDINDMDELKNFYQGATEAGIAYINVNGKNIYSAVTVAKRRIEARNE